MKRSAFRITVLASLCGTCALTGHAALAGVLPVYEISNAGGVQVGTNEGTSSSNNDFNLNVGFDDPLNGAGSVSARQTLKPSPSLTSSSSVTSLNRGGIFVQAGELSSLTYYFEALGPLGGTVSVGIQAQGGLEFSDDSHGRLSGGGEAIFSVQPAGDDDPEDQIVNDTLIAQFTDGFIENGSSGDKITLDGATGLQLNEDGSYTINANTVYEVSLSTNPVASGSIGDKRFDSFTTTAYLDPTFTLLTVDPAYSLEFSAGIGDGARPSSVPELPTWAMTIAGFGVCAIVAGLRRRAA
jgi:hypothetical protein